MDRGTIIGIASIVLSLVFVFFLILWIKQKLAKKLEEVKTDIRRHRERKVIGPESAHFSGSKREYGKVKGLGILALTEQRLLFNKIGGSLFAIGVDSIKSVENQKVFNGAYKGGKLHLVITLKDDNQVGFIVKDNAKWLKKLQQMH